MPSANFLEADYLANNPDVAAAVRCGAFSSGWDHFQKYGRLEGRSHRDPNSLTRREKALYGLDPSGLGLEIGASHSPIAMKKEGFNVHVLDHLDTEGIRAKYSAHGVSVDNVEEVDFIWKGQPLTETIGAAASYDWIIASHVIEHVPDPVLFLAQCEALLKPAGRLSLVIPDKRYCFDCLSDATTTGQLLDAFASRRTRPSPGQVFDYFANVCKRDKAIAWDATSRGPLELIHPHKKVLDRWKRAALTDEYLDVHCWRFTPLSFQLVLSDLQALGLSHLGVLSQFPTAGCEFFVSLGTLSDDELLPIDRLAALQGIRQA